MARLRDIAKMIRSKNAGPFELTVDIMFEHEMTYLDVKNSEVFTPQLISRLFSVVESRVRLIYYDPAFAIKITMPRFVTSGDVSDTDIFGGQQYASLVDLEIPSPVGKTVGAT